MKILLLAIVLLSCTHQKALAQTTTVPSAQKVKRPELVVGIVIDQMRWDFLYRFYDRYTDKGFKRLLNKGFTCENTIIPYMPTYTAPGHACIYTGAPPAINGIVSNYWYDKQLKKTVYCTDDEHARTIPRSESKAGWMSPSKLWTTTIGDELRLATNFRSKVIGISLKDRGAILPAGHSATAAYWFDDANGSFVTSSHYMDELPKWLQAFNKKPFADSVMAGKWTTLYPINTYIQSDKDSNLYERSIYEKGNTFPYDFSGMTKNKYSAFRNTPFANSYTVAMAIAAIEGEQLGSTETDMLAISFSQPDYMGHTFGPNSIEAEDTYLRLDRDLGVLLDYLENRYGRQFTVFLTADHGVAHVPSFLNKHKIPASGHGVNPLRQYVNTRVKEVLGFDDAVENASNYQLFFNDKVVTPQNRKQVTEIAIKRLLEEHFIGWALDLHDIANAALPVEVKNRVMNGYNQKLSGDIQIIYMPGWFAGSGSAGTTHGLWNAYDARIPLIWYGWGVKHGSLQRQVEMTDIAATLAAILKIQTPNGSIGKVIEEVLR